MFSNYSPGHFDAAPPETRNEMTPFRFAFITDTHLYLNAPKNFASGLQRQKESPELYKKLIEQLNAFAPAFVIHGGDIVCGGKSFDMTADDYEYALHRAKRFSERLNAPCYYIPGNHDLDPETGSKASYRALFGIDGRTYHSFVHEQIRFILLDAQEVPEDLTHGYIDTEQLTWLESELKCASDKREEIFIFAHQLLLPSVEFQGLGSRVANSAEVLEVVAPFERDILACFSGHLHLNRVYREQGILCIVSAGPICYPMTYRQIYVSADKFEGRTEQIELPDAFAGSEMANPDNNLYLSGRPRDQEFSIPRG